MGVVTVGPVETARGSDAEVVPKTLSRIVESSES
jgi:hypothetical protein